MQRALLLESKHHWPSSDAGDTANTEGRFSDTTCDSLLTYR
jgi:hypothetical protein